MDSGNALAQAHQLHERLKAQITERKFQAAEGTVKSLKLVLIRLAGLPPMFQQTPTQVAELELARSVFEQAVVLSVLSEKVASFELHFLQLKPYYTDTRHLIPPSPLEHIILGLNLLRLLVQNRIAEFHTELELLSPDAFRNDCIKQVVELEQALMEGAYTHVLSSRKFPHESFDYFMNLLVNTVREEVAGCSEKAYDHLSVVDAKAIFSFSKDQELIDFIDQEHPEWEIRNSVVYFQKARDLTACKEMPSLQLINQTLGYARELERIV